MSMRLFTLLVSVAVVLTVAVSVGQAQDERPPVSPPPLKLDGPPAPPVQPEIQPPAPPVPLTPPSAPTEPKPVYNSPLPLTPPPAPPTLAAPPVGATPPATPPAAGTPAPAAPTTPTGPAPATITIQVPANASLWFAEQKMNQSGPTRTFRSPPLETNKTYMYKVKVSWPSAPGQKDYSSEHEITVKGGQTTIIDFTPLARGPVPTAGQPPVGAVPQGQPQPQPPSRFQLPNLFRSTSGSRP